MNALATHPIPSSAFARFSRPVPRYTSYPSTPHFNNDVDAADYAHWLAAIGQDTPLSIYLHIPFCDRLCWFCACHTKHTLRYDPIAAYLRAVFAEIQWVARRTDGRGTVTAVHLGGGSPSLLKPVDLLRLKSRLATAFAVAPDAEISVEMDPNDLDEERLDGLAAFGMTRASFGVQDFNPDVQKAINRIQSFEQTAACIEGIRARGIRSINVDALYGLPFQTTDTIATTTAQILSLRPDRIALFGYAHVPWLKKHQTMIRAETLPNAEQRFAQHTRASRLIGAAGYQSIGFDHFALPDDSLARAARSGALRRNFQGYTADPAEILIGLGASAIGRFPQGYVQNVTATSSYQKRVLDGGPAVAKGHALSKADRRQAHVIERLLCDFKVDIVAAAGPDAALLDAFRKTATAIRNESAAMVSWDGRWLELLAPARPFARHFAAAFDTYLDTGASRHSAGI